MKKNFDLSIIIPTLNRRNLLKDSIECLIDEVKGHERSIEFLVLNNASDDGTKEWLETNFSGNELVKYVNFGNRVDVNDSFFRAVSSSTGKYVWIFGDDDFILPNTIRYILNIIQTKNDLGLIYINRLILDKDLNNINAIEHINSGIKCSVFAPSDFISKFSYSPGFITSVIFLRKVWNEGISFFKEDYYGYNFLGPIYAGLGNRVCYFIPFPLVIQRKGIPMWSSKWPLYLLVGLPNLFNDMDKYNFSKNSIYRWRKLVTTKILIITLLQAKYYQFSVNENFWESALRNQKGFKKIIANLIYYFVPSVLVRFIYSFKKTTSENK